MIHLHIDRRVPRAIDEFRDAARELELARRRMTRARTAAWLAEQKLDAAVEKLRQQWPDVAPVAVREGTEAA